MANIEWRSHGRKAKCEPDPNYPDGKSIDTTLPGENGYWVKLPYPAPECGVWIVTGVGLKRTAITAAGRPDDPKTVKIAYCDHTFIMRQRNDCGMPSHYLFCTKCTFIRDVGDSPC